MPTAYKNGIKGQFSQKSWDLMPQNKHGWSLTDGIPKNSAPPVEVLEFIDKTKRRNANKK